MRMRLVPKVGEKTKGFVVVRGKAFKAAFGRSGFKRNKREGDGATPLINLPLREAFYRRERLARPITSLPIRAIKHGMRWDDDASSSTYNRLTFKDLSESEEFLCRKDHLYNFIVVLGWNDSPIRKKRGSAIFWHGAREGFTPTAGCVATSLKTMRLLMPRLTVKSEFIPYALAPRKGRYRPE